MAELHKLSAVAPWDHGIWN